MKRSVQMLAVLSGLVCNTTVSFSQEREWQLDAVDQDVFLIFGVAETNDVGVSFWCKIGTQNVSTFTTAPVNFASGSVTAPMELTVEGVAYLLSGVVNADDTKVTLEAPLVPQDKILAALKGAERFSLRIGDHLTTYPLAGANFDGLLSLCAATAAEQP